MSTKGHSSVTDASENEANSTSSNSYSSESYCQSLNDTIDTTSSQSDIRHQKHQRSSEVFQFKGETSGVSQVQANKNNFLPLHTENPHMFSLNRESSAKSRNRSENVQNGFVCDLHPQIVNPSDIAVRKLQTLTTLMQV